MLLPTGAVVAVADGEKLILLHNTGHDGVAKLMVSPAEAVDGDHPGADRGHANTAGDPDHRQSDEDGFAVGVADLLNKEVLQGRIADLVIVAPPRTLGELRKHYHPKLAEVLRQEIGKELTGHSVGDVEKAIEAA
jgi:protein required for attachment to host cells